MAARSKKFFAARRAVVQSSTRRLYQVRALAGPKLAWSWLITVHIDYEWIDGGDFDGATVFEHAQSLGLEGIVSKHKNSRYVSGRSPYWLKMKNPESVAARREAEEEWGR